MITLLDGGMGSELRLRGVVVASHTGCEFWVSWTLHGNRMNTLPSGESLADAFAAFAEQEGGMEAAQKLYAEYEGLTAWP